MSTFLRLPLSLLAVLAALFFLPGIAWGDPVTPSAADCQADATPTGCPTGGDSSTGGGTSGDTSVGDTPTDPSKDVPAPGGPDSQAGTAGQQLVIPSFQLPSAPTGPVAGLDEVTPPLPPLLCDGDAATPLPPCPTLPGGTPGDQLTCDQLAQLLHLTGGCPSGFSCADLASLFGVTCPAGPPDCAALAAMFHLQGCPQPPTNCQEFADLLGVDNCSQIPCLDTSQLPAQARDGLAPLIDGLKQIGVKECPAKPAPTTPGKGTNMPPPQQPAQPQPYYANCTDARAHGATNIPQGSPGYRPELDADHDGYACDETRPAAVRTTQQPTGTLAYTGLDLGPQLKVAWTLLMLGAGMLIVGRRRV